MIVAALVLALAGWQGSIDNRMNALLGLGAPVIGGFFIAVTLVLLIADLKRPDRALFLVTKANPTSWLVWGGYILAIFGLIEAAWFGLAFFGLSALLRWLLLPAVLFGIAAAGYTAFLFGQARGRDLWLSQLLLPILLVQAVLAGAAALEVLAWILHMDHHFCNNTYSCLGYYRSSGSVAPCSLFGHTWIVSTGICTGSYCTCSKTTLTTIR